MANRAHPNRAAGGVMEYGVGRNYPKLSGAARSRPRRQSQRAVPGEQTGSGKTVDDKLCVYDHRTNMHFTLKTNPLKRSDLDEFVKLYKLE